MAALPARGTTNLQLSADVASRYAAQIECNRRFDELREWQTQLEKVDETGNPD